MTNEYDAWLAVDGPVALALTEQLEPAQADDAIVFPPTYAPFVKGDAPAYVIDETQEGKVALLDSVGSQANRMEPVFKQAPYSELIPKASIQINSRNIDLLDAGHRAADAVVRFSSKREDLTTAFRQIADKGVAVLMAKMAPTSLVFGAWDSRGSGVKLPRLVGATIRAYGVEEVSRAAQYLSTIKKDEQEALGHIQEALSEQGLSDAPAGKTRGGVIARKGIRREALLNLVALRSLSGGDPEATLKLQRYILGLAMVAITAPWKSYLREGCLLVTAAGEPPSQKLVHRNGTRSAVELDVNRTLSYAKAAAEDFGIGEGWEAAFEKGAVDSAVKVAQAKKPKKEKVTV